MNAEIEKIREPAVAGQFYPADPETLQTEILDMLDVDIPKPEGNIRALISPHAGYAYSGKTAGKGFSLLKGSSYDRIVVIAPSHYLPFSGLATADYTAFRTPLGDIPVDLDAVQLLLDTEPGIVKVITGAHQSEHALEVQLPFLQKVLPDTPIVPLICGRLKVNFAEKAANCLISLWESNTLWVISSDFTHFGRSFGYLPFVDDVENQLKELDMGAVNKILDLDFNGFSEYLDNTRATICGAGPIKILLKTIELSGCAELIRPELIECTNSGELTGDFKHCVGYSDIVFCDR